MARTIGNKGLELIKSFEGCRLESYKDSVGVWTIGYGHTAGVKAGMRISQATADLYLKSDCQKFANYVDNVSYVPVTKSLNDNQRDALISFAFNCGAGNLRTLCKDRSIKEIGQKITAYNKAGGRVLNGLVRRRKAEQDLFNTPVSGTSSNKPSTTNKNTNPYTEPTGILRKGSRGNGVKWVQWQLNKMTGSNLEVDGIFGNSTHLAVKAFKIEKGLAGNDIVDKNTRTALKGIVVVTNNTATLNNPYTKPSITLRKGSRGNCVKWLQWQLNKVAGTNLKIDGDFGSSTRLAVIHFQSNNGLSPDGVVGIQTRNKLTSGR